MNELTLMGLERALEETRKADRSGDVAAFLEANYVFRSIWVGRVRNPHLRDMIFRFDDQAGAVRRLTLALPQAREEALLILGRGLAAFRNGDAEAAKTFALRFIDGAERHFRTIATDIPEFQATDG